MAQVIVVFRLSWEEETWHQEISGAPPLVTEPLSPQQYNVKYSGY